MFTFDETQDLAEPHGAGIFAISYEMLGRALALPKGVRIIGIRDEGWSGSLDIAVRGPGLPPCAKGERMARVTAIATSSEGRVVSVEFEPVVDPAERELAYLRAEVARPRAVVQDDGR